MVTDAIAVESVPYRGVDRRQARREPVDVETAGTLGASIAIGALLVLVTGLVTAHPSWAQVLTDLRPVLRSALMTGAGILCLVHWQVVGRSRPALLGVALLVLGVVNEAVMRLAPVLDEVAGRDLPGYALGVAPTAVAACLVVWSRHSADVDARAHPRRLLVIVAALIPAGVGIVVLLAQQLELSRTEVLIAAAAAWRAGLWLAVAATERLTRNQPARPWVLAVLVLLTLTAVADAAAVLEPQPASSLAAVLAVAAGAVAVQGAARSLVGTLRAQSTDLHRLSLDVSDQRRREQWAKAEHEERLHEVRNVLAGIEGATSTLKRYEDRLDPGVRRRLEQAVTAELHRLEHLIDPGPAADVADLDVEAVLEPVLVTARQQGTPVRADLRGVSVLGHAADVATIASILLTNARVHAPGSPVMVRAEQRAGEVQLRFEDAGPGVPLRLREPIFERGERGAATAQGSGLGLYNARRLATAAGGTLHVESRTGHGSRFVLTLPAGSLAAARARRGARDGGAQVGQVDHARNAVVVPAQRDHRAAADL